MDKQKIALYYRPKPDILSFYGMIDFAVEHDMPAVEAFNHMELAEPDLEVARRLRAYADEKGIVFCCMSVYADLVDEDAAEQIERMKRYTDVAVVLGAPFIHHTVIPTNDHALLTPENREKFFWQAVEGIRQVYDYAAERGVRAIYEDQAFVVNGVEGIARLLDEVDRDIGLVADFGNIRQYGETIQPYIRRFADRIVHVHLKDMRPATPDTPNALITWDKNWIVETEPGTGDVDFVESIALLKEAGYDGWYALEYGAPTTDANVEAALARTREWLK
ncbi:MAG: sugar phosphate isomerase/epimerase [Clostridia bacterium]|nr:sugar phosphate isomerase/epimerase [Clostridia bacterium]